MQVYKTKVCVVGGGSGGIGAAIGAAANGAETMLIEKNHVLGGTVTMAWVHTWEPVCGTSALCKRLWDRMRQIPNGADADYALSLSRLNPDTGDRNPPLPFEPWAYLHAVDDEISATGGITVLYNSRFVSCATDGRRVRRVICSAPEGPFAVEADVFIDCTDEIYLSRAAGCGWSLGAESKREYDEPHAPEKAAPGNLNEVNWIYRVRPSGRAVKTDFEDVPEKARINALFSVAMPCGDMLVNICGHGTMSPERPEEFSRMMHDQRKIAWDSYRWQIINGNHPDWEFIGLAPQIGIREGYRLKARYVVSENDVEAGAAPDREYAALCDHRLDIHGCAFGHELAKPFGVPIESLMSKEYDNLFAACRGAGFSHIAAGSCRLSRTMLTLGEAAGKFVAENLVNQ